MKPVQLRPGRARLATKPLPTGSVTLAKMTGILARVFQQCRRRRRAVRKNGVGPRGHEFAGQGLHFFDVAGRPAIVESNVAPFPPSKVLQPLSECRDESLPLRIILGIGHQHADASHPVRLLRARGHRPTERRAAKQPDDVAPLHVSVPRPRRQHLIGSIDYFDRAEAGIKTIAAMHGTTKWPVDDAYHPFWPNSSSPRSLRQCVEAWCRAGT